MRAECVLSACWSQVAYLASPLLAVIRSMDPAGFVHAITVRAEEATPRWPTDYTRGVPTDYVRSAH